MSDSKTNLEITASPGFTLWLAEQNVSLAVSSYQTGKLFFLGAKGDGRLSAFQRSFARCLGLCSDQAAQTIWMTTQYQNWRLVNMLAPGQTDGGFDRLYVPQCGFVTGDLDAHDIAVTHEGQVIFVNTRFSCLATNTDRASFRFLWKPPFITKVAPEDRCHLNGLAMVNGRPKYVTVCSRTDTAEGWRTHRVGGGCVLDVETGEAIVEGLSMPHSPRVYRERLWLLNSGEGDFGYVDLKTGRFQSVAFCSGYARLGDRWNISSTRENISRIAVGHTNASARDIGSMRIASHRLAKR
jgi:uncharacterized protein (TIGR03032 family)